MAQSGYTPILIYASGTATNVPSASNLTSSASGAELALNYTDGKLYYKDNSGVVQLIASKAGASGSVTSVAQSFTGGLISVSGSPITTSGTLALTVAGTSGGIPYFSSGSAWASSAALAANALMIGGGAGAAPSTITTGTGVVTALGVNVGSSGAFVVNGGALGTPSSGTVTNLTGTASININGTVGATTPAAGSFTTLSATLNSSTTTGISTTNSSGGTLARTGLLATGDAVDGFFGVNGSGYTGVAGWSDAGIININSASNGLILGLDGVTKTQVTSSGLAVTGALSCTGALSKGSGSFRIEHPLPQLSETHQLVHSFIEGPQADLIYRGKVTLVDGMATVNIDSAARMTEGTFDVLCRNIQCFTTNESGWTPVRGSVSGNVLTIEAQDKTSSASISWMVIGERKDKHIMETDWTDDDGRVIVEPLKPVDDVIQSAKEKDKQ